MPAPAGSSNCIATACTLPTTEFITTSAPASCRFRVSSIGWTFARPRRRRTIAFVPGKVGSWIGARRSPLATTSTIPACVSTPTTFPTWRFKDGARPSSFSVHTRNCASVCVRRIFVSTGFLCTVPQWPVGIGAKGNEGVANQTTQTSGAIGYVEYAYVKQTNMNYARLVNRDGKLVAPEAKAFQAAAANADWARAEGYYLILTNQSGAASWPITGASFILVHADSKDPNTAAALKFFDWAYKSGQPLAESLDYVPLPAGVVKLVEKTWQDSLKVNGNPVWPAK